MWTTERKLEATVAAPLGEGLHRDDTRVIRRPGWYQLVTPSAPGTTLNEVALSQVEPQDAEGVIDDVIATYRSLDHPVKWCVGPWTRPPDLAGRLERRGFVSWDVRGMGIDTNRSIAAPQDVSVVEVGEGDLDAFVATSLRGWNVPAEQADVDRRVHLAALRRRPRTAVFFAAVLDGEWVGTAGIFLREDHGYLVATQVLAEARGRGVYRALLAARLAFLSARDLRLACIHARESTSAPILEHVGFETLFRSRCYLLE